MYTDWFKLKKLPFRLRPDPEFLYLADATGTVYAALRAAVTGGQKIVCLLGESGVGKTTLLHAVARDCQRSVSVVRVQQPNLTSQELAATVAAQFGLPPQDDMTHDVWAQLIEHAAAESARGRVVALLVDEAHRCSSQMLRDLLDIAAWPAAPLVVLAGEEELSNSLSKFESSGTQVPTITTLRLARLSQVQIAGYLNYRLRIAGSEGRELFEPDTTGEIMRYTGGTPQLINTLCDSAMMFAEAHNMARVGIIEIRDAVRELNWIEFSARSALTVALADTANSVRTGAARRSSTLGLEVRHDEQIVSHVALELGCLLVGRGQDAGLRLDSRFISRRHCQFVTTADQTIIEDLDSANGILVNGQRCRAHRLVPGDKIALSDYTLTCITTPTTAET
jgi:general secretion pathway protein A